MQILPLNSSTFARFIDLIVTQLIGQDIAQPLAITIFVYFCYIAMSTNQNLEIRIELKISIN